MVKPSLSSKISRALARLLTAIATCSMRLTFMACSCSRIGETGKLPLRLAIAGLGQYRSRAFDPDGGVVEARATVRRYRIVADQGVDGAFLCEGFRRPDPFHDQGHFLLAGVELGCDEDAAASIADAHQRSLRYAFATGGTWMQAQAGSALFGNRGRRLRKCAVEEVACG